MPEELITRDLESDETEEFGHRFIDVFENEVTDPSGFRATYSRNGNSCVRTVMVPYEDHAIIVKGILGYTTFEDGKLKRRLPMRDKVNRGMYAQQVTVRGSAYIGASYTRPAGQTINLTDPEEAWPFVSENRYRYAILTIQFGVLPFDLAQNIADPLAGDSFDRFLGKDPGYEARRYCEKSVTMMRTMVTARAGGFVWSDAYSGPDSLAAALIRHEIPETLAQAEITIRWRDMPLLAVPIEKIENCMGKVNSKPNTELPGLPPPTFYDKESLYLESYELSSVYMPDQQSTRCYDVTYFMRWREQGFNHIPAPIPKADADGNNAQLFRRVWRRPNDDGVFPKNSLGENYGIFDLADFEDLFRPAAA